MKSLSSIKIPIVVLVSLIALYLISCSRSKDGEDKQSLEACYKLADTTWSEDEYTRWLLTVYSTNDSVTPYNVCDTFPYKDSENKWTYFSHRLPGEKTQQYYEMIGKYDQFAWGWKDYEGAVGDDVTPIPSPNWEAYLQCLEGTTGNNKLLPTQFDWKKFG